MSRPTSSVITYRSGDVMCRFLSDNDEWYIPIPRKNMGNIMPRIVVALEDRRFMWHHGIDTLALCRACLQNLYSSSIISGASTISSQVIRLTNPVPRSIRNKFCEFFAAVILERLYTKDEILEMYLNNATFGANIRGIEAASLVWFGHPAKSLSIAEATLLAGMLRGPSFYRPDRHPSRVSVLRNRLLDQLCVRGVISKTQRDLALKEPIPLCRQNITNIHHITADKILRECNNYSSYNNYGTINSTIDKNFNGLIQNEMDKALNTLPQNITCAAVLIHNKSGEVQGYIGNGREGQNADWGFVDCADSFRSPGSTLKPFVYGRAFDKGLLTPASLLPDVPFEEGISPRNFDRSYRGAVSARTALADSLNIPAVRALRISGYADILDLYRRLGFSAFTKSYTWYGDSLVLGGCEVTTVENAAAYRVLANRGRYSPLKWCSRDNSKVDSYKVLSHESCAMVLDILCDNGRLIPLYRDFFNAEGSSIAFKTGTSHGLRDAWTVAVTKDYTLSVWFGNPQGISCHNLTGIDVAMPVAIRILRQLSAGKISSFVMPDSCVKQKLCSLSGDIPNRFCTHKVSDYVIKNVSQQKTCTMHTIVDGHVAIRWTPELEAFYSRNTSSSHKDSLHIKSPTNGVFYIAENGIAQIPAICVEANDVFWFVNGKLTFSPSSNSDNNQFFKLTPGYYKVSAIDNNGTSDFVHFTVRSDSATPNKDTFILNDLEEEELMK